MRFTLATVIAVLPVFGLTLASPALRAPHTKIPLSKRSDFTRADGSVNAEKLRGHLAASTAKIQRGFTTYETNTGAKHPLAATSGASKRDTGKDSLKDDNSQLWYGSISVGTPATTYTVDFDTGSSDLFLPGPDCGSTCSGHTAYDPSKSSSSKDIGKDFSLAYGDGSTVSGEQYSDVVTIAGLTAMTQTVGAAKQYSSGFESSQFPADGLLGMGFKSISVYKADPLFQTLVSEGETSSSVFAFKLSSSGAELSVGGTDSSLYSGDFTYAKVETEGYWQVALDSISTGGSEALSSQDAIIDTGTTLIVGTSSNVAKFYDSVKGSKKAPSSAGLGEGFYTVPCDSIPSISLTFGGKSFDVDSTSFSLGPVSSGSSDCVGGIAAQDTGSSFWIVGGHINPVANFEANSAVTPWRPLLPYNPNTYTVFDVAKSRVGFAKLT